MQDEIARNPLISVSGPEPVIQFTAEEEADVFEADQREFVADENICAIFARHPS